MRYRKYTIVLILFPVLCSLFSVSRAFAGPASTNYELKSYGFGSGGADNTSSENYKMNGTLGEVEYGRPSSTNFKMNTGLNFTQNANVPGQPTFTNPGTNYDRLKFVLNTSGNPSDTTYAIAISTDNFATDIRYIKSDFTIGSSLTTNDFQTYANWGGASGNFVTGLSRNTTYSIKVKARKGNFSETVYGPPASGSTSDPSFTFGLDSYTISFANLNAGNSYTDSSKTTVMTTSTNAYNGYTVYAKITQPLTSTTGTIANFASVNSSPTSWTGTGFGYTTNDPDLQSGSGGTTRFSGSKYAGFTTTASQNPVADHIGPIMSPISSEQFTVTYRLTADSTTNSGTYTSTIEYIATPNY
jgi:hypothetical protein